METNNTLRLDYHVAGEERKRLVKTVAECMESVSEYLGAPSFAYRVGKIIIDRNGVLTFEEPLADEELEWLTEYLATEGFVAEAEEPVPRDEAEETEVTESNAEAEMEVCEDEAGAEMEESEAQSHEETPMEGNAEESQLSENSDVETVDELAEEEDGKNEEDRLTISMPRDFFTDTALENLQKIVDSKRKLLMKSLEAEELPVEITDETVSFPWFKNPDGDGTEAATYTHLISSICQMAKEAKRVTATEKETESEKYTFRCFLLRLGFVGNEYKHERAVLMKNLSGHAAFKTMAEAEAFNEKLKAKKAAERAAACAQEDSDTEHLSEPAAENANLVAEMPFPELLEENR